jgi:hypothetical protein
MQWRHARREHKAEGITSITSSVRCKQKHSVNLKNSKEDVLESDNRYMVSKIEQMRRVH